MSSMKYLVVEAHPDDLVFFCGGTVAKLIAQGHEIAVLTVTDGQQGTLEPAFDSEEKLARVMRQEQGRACSRLGIQEVTFLGARNHFLLPTHDLREKITRHVRQVQPAAVFTFDPWNFDENPDHRAVGLATLEACSFAHMHLFHPEHLQQGLSTAMVAKVILYKTPNPNTFVDVSTTLDQKIEAALAYESQIELMKEEGRLRLEVLGQRHPIFEGDFAEIVAVTLRQLAAETGKQAGMPAAEAFQVRGLGILENAKPVVGELGI
jgi:LmbE family N-acetylglucosaminyl deacetylase